MFHSVVRNRTHTAHTAALRLGLPALSALSALTALTAVVRPAAAAPQTTLYVANNGGGNNILKTVDVSTGSVSSNTIIVSSGALAGPFSLAFDKNGNLYMANYTASTSNATVEQVTPIGANTYTATQFSQNTPGNTYTQMAFDSSGNLFVGSGSASGGVYKFDSAGNGVALTVTGLTSGAINGVAADVAGNLYVSNADTNQIFKLAVNNTANTAVATALSLTFTGGASLTSPRGLAFDSSGNLYVAEGTASTAAILKITAGNGGALTASNFATSATSGHLFSPTSLAFDGSGNLYLSDYNAAAIDKFTSAGGQGTVAATGGLVGPRQIAFGYVAPSTNALGLQSSAAPEPGSLALLAMSGLPIAGVAAVRRRRSRRQK